MSKEDNSESINFENEQIEQRTLNSDEERKIKKTEVLINLRNPIFPH